MFNPYQVLVNPKLDLRFLHVVNRFHGTGYGTSWVPPGVLNALIKVEGEHFPAVMAEFLEAGGVKGGWSLKIPPKPERTVGEGLQNCSSRLKNGRKFIWQMEFIIRVCQDVC